MHRDLAYKLASFDDLENWKQWLTFAKSFHQYSFANSCRILMANPNATLVAGYVAWQAKGHQVRRGETAIKVLAPVTRKVPIEDARGHPMLDAKGRPLQRRQIVGVRVARVFDASQVDPPPESRQPQPQLLAGAAPSGLWDSITELLGTAGFTVSRGDCGAANGLTDFAAKQVRVRADVDDAHAVRTLAHEAGHVLTMDLADIASSGSSRCRGISEVIAESVAYIVTQAHGLDASQYTFNYVAGWAAEAAGRNGDTRSIDQIVKETGDRVISAAHRILSHTKPASEGAVSDELKAAPEAATFGATPEAAVWETVPAHEVRQRGDRAAASTSRVVGTRHVSV